MSYENKEKFTKNFGYYLLSIILFVISIYPLANENNINIIILILSIISLTITLFFHNLMEKPAHLWFLIGKIYCIRLLVLSSC